jgi:hypothetical protein
MRNTLSFKQTMELCAKRASANRFATILGIGFPIALLIFLRWTRGRESSVPMMT